MPIRLMPENNGFFSRLTRELPASATHFEGSLCSLLKLLRPASTSSAVAWLRNSIVKQPVSKSTIIKPYTLYDPCLFLVLFCTCEIADNPRALDIQADCVEYRRLLAGLTGEAGVPKDYRKLTIF